MELIIFLNGCIRLKTIPNTLFNNSNQLTELVGCFKDCVMLSDIPESFKLPVLVNNISYLFYNCQSIKYLPEKFVTSYITNYEFAFYYCHQLTKLPRYFCLSAELTNLSNTFAYCINLTELPANFWPTNRIY
jgi:hypothetical protein